MVSVEQYMCYRSQSKHPIHGEASCGVVASREEPRVAAINSAATKTSPTEAEDPHCSPGDPNLLLSERWCSIRSEMAVGSEEGGPLACPYVACPQTFSHAPALAAHKDKHIRQGIMW